MGEQMNQRLEAAKKNLEGLLGREGLLEFSFKFHTKYENPTKSKSPYRTSALTFCQLNMTYPKALDTYIEREHRVKARYLEMVTYRYDTQLKLL